MFKTSSKTPALVDITLDRIGHVIAVGLGNALEEHGLAHHRADATHLEHQPLQRLGALLRVVAQEHVVFFGEVPKDRARFEDRKIVVPPIDDGRDAAVRVELQIVWRLLLFLRRS